MEDEIPTLFQSSPREIAALYVVIGLVVGFVLALLCATAASAAPLIKYQPVYVFGPNATQISAAQHENLVDEVINQFRSIGVPIKRLRSRYIADPCSQYDALSKRFERLYCLGSAARKLRLIRRNVIVHFTVPLSEGRYLQGVARKTCGFRYSRFGYAYSYANAAEFNSRGENFFRHSIVAATHENGHILGAEHDDSSPNMMHSSANEFTTRYWPLRFTQTSIDQIRNCIR